MQSNANLLNERRYYCDNPIFEQYYEIFTHLCTLWRADSEVILNDGSKKVFLNADGKNGAVSEELKAFLAYVAGRPSEDTFVKKLKRAVEKAKKNREWRHEYMTLLMRDQENQKIGEKRGEDKLAKLIILLNEDGRLSDILRVSQDEEYRQELYEEYHII